MSVRRCTTLVVGLLAFGLAGCASSKSKRTTPQAEGTDKKTVKKPKKKSKKKPKKKPKIVSNPKDWNGYQGRIVKRITATGLKRTKLWRLKHLNMRQVRIEPGKNLLLTTDLK